MGMDSSASDVLLAAIATWLSLPPVEGWVYVTVCSIFMHPLGEYVPVWLATKSPSWVHDTRRGAALSLWTTRGASMDLCSVHGCASPSVPIKSLEIDTAISRPIATVRGGYRSHKRLTCVRVFRRSESVP